MDAEIRDNYARILRKGFEIATSESEPISDELDAEALRSLLASGERLSDQMEHSILDAPWLRGDVTRLVDEWIEQPGALRLSDLQSKLDPLFGPSRSLMIARTEVGGAFAGGLAAGLRAHGWTHVRWIAAADACPICLDLDGTVMTIGEYEADPLAHPACGCTAEPDSGEDTGEESDDEAAEA